MAGLILPRQVAGSASGWTLIDFVTLQARSDPAAGGRAAIEFDQLDTNELLLVDHAVVFCDSAAPTSVRWYAGGEDPQRLLDGSDRGNFDVADWPAGLQLTATSLLVVWSGATDGAIGALTAQARLLRRS